MKHLYSDTVTPVVQDEDHNVHTGFLPKLRPNCVIVLRSEESEGVRISLSVLSKMNDICTKIGIELTVLLIPSKE